MNTDWHLHLFQHPSLYFCVHASVFMRVHPSEYAHISVTAEVCRMHKAINCCLKMLCFTYIDMYKRKMTMNTHAVQVYAHVYTFTRVNLFVKDRVT